MFSGSIRVVLLAGLFGTGSWIAITGLWLELPLLIERLPERWSLASQLNLVIQSANVGPLIYWILHRHDLMNDITATHLQLIIGILSSIALIFFWQTTVFIFNAWRSVVLFACTFGMALVDCTSSITFLTFMAKFDSKYMSPYLVGEGLSGFIPSMIAMLQGVGDEQTSTAVPLEPRFSIEVFILGLLGTLSLSYIAFLALQWTPIAKREMEKLSNQIKIQQLNSEKFNFELQGIRIADNNGTNTEISDVKEQNTRIWNEAGGENFKANKDESLSSQSQQQSHCGIVPGTVSGIVSNSTLKQDVKEDNSRRIYFLLLGLMAWNCFTTFGFMPSIQPFSGLPYGYGTLHYIVIFAGLAYPFGCSFAMFLKTKSIRVMICLTLMGGLFAGYIFYVALNSEQAPFLDSPWGGRLMIGAWIGFVTIISYAKTLITVWICDYNRSDGMFWVGMTTQFGGCLGAAVAYGLVNHTNFLQSH